MKDMDCRVFSNQLDESLDGTLTAERQRAMDAHERTCEACSSAAHMARRVMAGLRALPAPPSARAGFAARALRHARRASPECPTDRSAWRDGAFALSGAAAAGLGMAVVLWNQTGDSTEATTVELPVLETVTLTEGEVESLRMRIDAPRHFDGVRFSVELPEQVWLAEQPGIRAMTWEGELLAGENLLELPLMALAGANGTVTARVTWGDQERRLQAQIVSVAPVLELDPAAGGSGRGT